MRHNNINDSYATVRSALVCALQDDQQSVIMLRGLWGTGKTHLWRSVRSDLGGNNLEIGRSIYASMFGLKSADEIKWSILRSAYSTDKTQTKKLIQTAAQIGSGWLSRFVGAGAFNAALLWLPDLLKERLVVIDDIERKHGDFSLDEFLGFLEEYTELYGTRFLILMNDSALSEDQDTWHKLKEKVVDIEIVLQPAPSDAFLVAAKDLSLPQLDRVRAACTSLGLTNIRIIRKALHFVSILNDIVGDDVQWNPWAQSTVLLTAIHFRGIDDPPTMEFITSYNQFSQFFRDKKTDVPANVTRWEGMLVSLGFHNADEFEVLIIKYLETGLLDNSALRNLFDGYRADADGKNLQERISGFFEAWRWEQDADNPALIAKLSDLLPCAGQVSAQIVGDLARVATELGDEKLGQKFLDGWCAAADTRTHVIGKSPFPIDMEIARLHPQIADKVRAIRTKTFPPRSLREAILHIVLERSWGGQEEQALLQSSAQTYRETLEQLTARDLRRFMQQHAEWIKSQSTWPPIVSATTHFIEACRDIQLNPTPGRLASIIAWYMEAEGLSGLLEQSC